jgi:hypothetical protein
MKSCKTAVRILISFLSLFLFSIGFSTTATGQAPLSDIAIKGYDTVAYFKGGKPLLGSESYTFQWHGMTWLFSSRENRDLFAKSPAKYAPQYDGYCAWAMTEARKAKTDPEVWKIVDNRLYLNCSRAAYEKWSADIPGNIKKGDANWLKFQALAE